MKRSLTDRLFPLTFQILATEASAKNDQPANDDLPLLTGLLSGTQFRLQSIGSARLGDRRMSDADALRIRPAHTLLSPVHVPPFQMPFQEEPFHFSSFQEKCGFR